ncbi:hypothetical protein JCM11251_007908 [Rhodosporidiobolus azoricus]
MASGLFDQSWFSAIPQFWSSDDHLTHTASESPAASRSSFRQPTSKHTIGAVGAKEAGQQQAEMPKVKGRKSNALQKKNKAYSKKDVHAANGESAPSPSGLPIAASASPPTSSAYPQTFSNNDLASADLGAPRRSTVPLPQSYEDSPFFYSAGTGDSHAAQSPLARSFVRPALDEEYGHPQGRDTSAASGSSGFTSTGSSLSSTEFDYSGDEEDLSDAEYADIDDLDERPFPSPQKAKQEKYLRRAADFGLYSPSPSASSGELPPVEDVVHQPFHKSIKGKGKALSVKASWADPSLLPPTVAPSTTAYAHPSPAAAPLITPSTAHSHLTSKISHLNQLPRLPPSPPAAAALDAYYSPPASALESPTDKFPRGRNPHPRLLWRSLLDKEALAVLDAHHDRVVGGPLPRMAVSSQSAVAESEATKLGASGIEREREHAGAREEGERGRSRSERRFRAGGGRGRRDWSVEGRKWSREVERCGL